MPKTPPPHKAPVVAGAFTRRASTDALNAAPKVPSPPPPPPPAQGGGPLRAVPVAAPDTDESIPEPSYSSDARVPQPESSVPTLTEARSAAADHAAVDPRGSSDPARHIDDLVREAVRATREQDRANVTEVVQRLATVSNRDRRSLVKLLDAVLAVPSAGKAQMPLEIAPHLHQKLKAEANRNSRPGAPSNMTTLVLLAIGEAYESDILQRLVDAHKDGERHKVPLFGNLKVGTAPRGETKRMQFQPPTTARTMIDILATWYQVDFVVLVRLALEAQFNKRRRRPTETPDVDEN